MTYSTYRTYMTICRDAENKSSIRGIYMPTANFL